MKYSERHFFDVFVFSFLELDNGEVLSQPSRLLQSYGTARPATVDGKTGGKSRKKILETYYFGETKIGKREKKL